MFSKGITEYITHYCDVKDKGFKPDGTLTDAAIRQGLRELLKHGVFASPRNIQESALRSHSIIIPLYLFE